MCEATVTGQRAADEVQQRLRMRQEVLSGRPQAIRLPVPNNCSAAALSSRTCKRALTSSTPVRNESRVS